MESLWKQRHGGKPKEGNLQTGREMSRSSHYRQVYFVTIGTLFRQTNFSLLGQLCLRQVLDRFYTYVQVDGPPALSLSTIVHLHLEE